MSVLPDVAFLDRRRGVEERLVARVEQNRRLEQAERDRVETVCAALPGTPRELELKTGYTGVEVLAALRMLCEERRARIGAGLVYERVEGR